MDTYSNDELIAFRDWLSGMTMLELKAAHKSNSATIPAIVKALKCIEMELDIRGVRWRSK